MQKGKILGQAAPGPTVLEPVYVVPPNTMTAFNIYICNRDVADDYFSIALVPSGQNLDLLHYVAYNCKLNIGEIISFNGITMTDGDIIYVSNQNGSCSFTVTGLENS